VCEIARGSVNGSKVYADFAKAHDQTTATQRKLAGETCHASIRRDLSQLQVIQSGENTSNQKRKRIFLHMKEKNYLHDVCESTAEKCSLQSSVSTCCTPLLTRRDLTAKT
jgi:hypothetical protein